MNVSAAAASASVLSARKHVRASEYMCTPRVYIADREMCDIARIFVLKLRGEEFDVVGFAEFWYKQRDEVRRKMFGRRSAIRRM